MGAATQKKKCCCGGDHLCGCCPEFPLPPVLLATIISSGPWGGAEAELHYEDPFPVITNGCGWYGEFEISCEGEDPLPIRITCQGTEASWVGGVFPEFTEIDGDPTNGTILTSTCSPFYLEFEFGSYVGCNDNEVFTIVITEPPPP